MNIMFGEQALHIIVTLKAEIALGLAQEVGAVRTMRFVTAPTIAIVHCRMRDRRLQGQRNRGVAVQALRFDICLEEFVVRVAVTFVARGAGLFGCGVSVRKFRFVELG